MDSKLNGIGVLKTELDLKVDQIIDVSVNWETCIKKGEFSEEEIRMISEFEGMPSRKRISFFKDNSSTVHSKIIKTDSFLVITHIHPLSQQCL